MFSVAKLFFGSPLGIGFLIVVAGIILGGIGYHYVQVGMLERSLKTKQEQVEDLTTKNTQLVIDKTQLAGQVRDLKTVNKQCADTLEKQNAAIESVLADKATSEGKWRKAVADANRNVADSAKLIDQILNGKPAANQGWCEFWAGQARAYVRKRQGAK